MRGTRLPQEIRLTIADQGPGLGQVPEMVFERFHRGESDDRKGSGLGLAIAKAFADAMEVKLIAESHPEQGAAFSLSFDGGALPTVRSSG